MVGLRGRRTSITTTPPQAYVLMIPQVLESLIARRRISW